MADHDTPLRQYYASYTAAFFLVVLLLAVLERYGMPPRWIGYAFRFLTILLYATIGVLARTTSVTEYYVAGRRVPAVFNGMATGADWMSAASFISMAGEGAENWNLWLTNSDGTKQQQLTHDIDVLSGAGPPVWSPDGQWIAFGGAVTYEGPMSQIDLWLIAPDGNDFKRLTYGQEYEVNNPSLNETAILQVGTNCACFLRRKSEVYSRLQHS